MITVDSLRKAIAAHLGVELTPEIAVAIELASHDTDDHSLRPAMFPVQHYRDLTFQVESFRDIQQEIHVLHELHFAETERHLGGISLNPDYQYLRDRERQGTLVQFTARSNGKLVGNLRMYLATSVHTGSKIAEEDTFFLLPECRKGFIAIRFLQYVEECLVRILGVREIRANSKIVNNAHRLMDYMGYRHFANQYVKIF